MSMQKKYSKSVKIPNGSITAYINKPTDQLVEVYIERVQLINGFVEKENMMPCALNCGLSVIEDNLHEVLNNLAQIVN